MTLEPDLTTEVQSAHKLEKYSLGYQDKVLNLLQTRTARSCAQFVLPHLFDGMTMLDCGCGPGSITSDFADLVPSGLVFGIDSNEKSIQSAKAFSQSLMRRNLHFATANTYQLPFDDGAFDGIYAHSLLMHLAYPVNALKEMRRVLKPGGFAAIADPDFGARVWFPASDLMDHFQSIYLRVLLSNAVTPYSARAHRAALLEAGFTKSEGHSFSVEFGNTEATSMIAESWVSYTTSESSREIIMQNGWADNDDLRMMCEEVIRWGKAPESFLGLLCCGALGWR